MLPAPVSWIPDGIELGGFGICSGKNRFEIKVSLCRIAVVIGHGPLEDSALPGPDSSWGGVLSN
jgi:hypothetical protein